MAQQVSKTITPNIVAALPGRMVDEAPKRHSVADRGVREQKLIPTLVGLLGSAVVAFVLVMTDALTMLLAAERMMMYLGLAALVLAMFLGMVVGFGGYTYLNLRTRSYRLYDDRVEMREGFLKQEARSLPYDRVTNVTLRQNVWERLFDAGTIQLQTVGSGDVELWIRGVDSPDGIAEQIRQRVRDADVTGVQTDA
jgi:uncharacterized membrane protein YdbT with pleckstrin-like domain